VREIRNARIHDLGTWRPLEGIESVEMRTRSGPTRRTVEVDIRADLSTLIEDLQVRLAAQLATWAPSLNELTAIFDTDTWLEFTRTT